MIGHEPTLITSAENADAGLPTGEPVAKAPQMAPTAICDPRLLLQGEGLESPEEVTEGDWIAAAGWTRPRLVEFVDASERGAVLYLADPDESRTNEHGIRRLDSAGWKARSGWWRYPNLRRVWDAAHGGS